MQQPRVGTRTRMNLRWALGFTLLLSAASGIGAASTPAAEGPSSGPAERFLAAREQEQPVTQYRAYRRMHARSERFNQEGWLEAWTELDQGGFHYTVVSETGSEYVRNKVLKAVLKREQELIADGDCRRSEITADNYEFRAAPEADGERHVILKPKRKDVLLVDGHMVLSEDGSDLLRVEGRLSKNPSFWTGLVNVVRHYARLDGIRVPVSTESVAKVKVAGTSRLEMHYEYETINGRPVSLAARRIAPPPGTR
jgi:hypothetical protein